MVISRYLNRQLALTLTGVTGVLLMIIVGGRFIKYLADAAAGKIAADALLSIMLLRLPGFLELLLPLAFFLSVLLVHGRMYMDSEMVVLSAAGVSPNQILKKTLNFSFIVAAIVALLTLVISPMGAQKVEQLIAKQKQLAQFTLLVPGQFQRLKDNRVVYVESLGEGNTMNNVFIADQKTEKDDKEGITRERQITVFAKEGFHRINPETGVRELVLQNGKRYLGTPGDYDYQIIQFDTLIIALNDDALNIKDKPEARSTLALYQDRQLANWVELNWRISLIISVLVIACLAVPLSRVNPRQGRFIFILPAILLYMSYLALQVFVREALVDEKLPMILGFWWIHGLYLCIAWFFFRKKLV